MSIDKEKIKEWHDRIFTKDTLDLMDFLKPYAGDPEVAANPTHPFGAYKMQPGGNPDDQGICHHFNNQMVPVAGFLEIAQMPGLTDEQVEKHLQTVVTALEKMQKFIPPAVNEALVNLDNLYPDAARRDEIEKHLLELGDLIKRSVRVRSDIIDELKAQQLPPDGAPLSPPR